MWVYPFTKQPLRMMAEAGDWRSTMPEEEKGFVIKDRRMFTEGKDEEVDKKTDDAKADEPPPKDASGSVTDDIQDKIEDEEETLLPEVNFPTFIMSLNASALVHLGVIEDPATGQSSKNLPMAKQTIDILSMLEEKTRGNLAKDEEDILRNILYDLRIAYVRQTE
jgi:hypothetical protein